ncbi:MAG TPA: tail fiber domain-containing protein [Gemmatimonadales bacterium]|nr:tail fiber domain-containing protein [Gemmatimonadales bacterium]
MTSTARARASTVGFLAAALIGLAAPAAAQTQLFEVEKSDETKLLQVSDDAGLVVRGTFDAGAIPASGAGVRLMWYPRKAAFRAGRIQASQWDDASVGQWSVAFGQNTTASGTHSAAFNGGTTASGDRSVAMGGGTLASGAFAVATGQSTVASGTFAVATGGSTVASGLGSFVTGSGSTASGVTSIASGESSVAAGGNSVALGFRVQANGNASTATGTGTVAAGAASVALGTGVTAQGDGSFVFGDRSTNFPFTAAANTFMVRAFGGIGLNTGVNIGCDLPANTGTWACTSSRLAKEGFEDVDGEDVLAKLAAIRIQRWRYLGSPAEHVGPTAEDFREAFGLGESSTKIAGVDADGIALRAVQALERRTTELREENAALRRRLGTLEGALGELRAGRSSE